MAARLFTHGYDFFAPVEAVVYHLWNRGHRPPFTEVRHESRETLKKEATEKVLSLLKGTATSSVNGYGLGDSRTIAEFEESLGVSFQSMQMTGGGGGGNGNNDNGRTNWKSILSDLNDYSETLHGANVEDNDNNESAPMKSLEILKLLKNYL